MSKKTPKLIVVDLDNSCFNWIEYFGPATKASILEAAEMSGISYNVLCEEFKEVLDKEKSIEYPFVIQQLPSILRKYNNNKELILSECSEPARESFKSAAYPSLKPYEGVVETLKYLKEHYPNTKLAVLTDAPHKVAVWRLSKLGILNYFDGVYGLEDPRLPILGSEVMVSQRTLLKNIDGWTYGFLGRQRTLPNDYEKPSIKGFNFILNDLDIVDFTKEEIIFAGDNVYKDIPVGLELGITSVWLKFGTNVNPQSMKMLEDFVPHRFIHKGIDPEGDFPQADYTINSFAELLKLIN